jgi:predicted membrane channel-forming protein YqfA (hemolysin III family)
MIGGSLFFIAVGAILAFAVKGHSAHVDLVTVGYILMAVGAVALVIGLVQFYFRRPPAGPEPPVGV